MIYRLLSEDDAEAFLELKKKGLTSNPESFVASLDEDEQDYFDKVRNRLRNNSAENGDIILGSFSPGLVGIISVTRNGRKKRFHKADLHGMYVLPEYRGHGVGRKLFEQILEMAKQMEGLEEIQLRVSTKNKDAINLYKRFGFEVGWEEKHALKMGNVYIDAYHMILCL